MSCIVGWDWDTFSNRNIKFNSFLFISQGRKKKNQPSFFPLYDITDKYACYKIAALRHP